MLCHSESSPRGFRKKVSRHFASSCVVSLGLNIMAHKAEWPCGFAPRPWTRGRTIPRFWKTKEARNHEPDSLQGASRPPSQSVLVEYNIDSGPYRTKSRYQLIVPVLGGFKIPRESSRPPPRNSRPGKASVKQNRATSVPLSSSPRAASWTTLALH